MTKEWYLRNKDKMDVCVRDWQSNNREKMRANQSRYHQLHKIEIATYKNEYRKRKMKDDIQFRLKINLRHRLLVALNKKQRGGSVIRDLGCSILELKNYLESKFTEGMSWERRGEIHIDHIIPLSSFDLTNREHFLKANHYTNLQPLWAVDNIRKGNKLSISVGRAT